MSEGSLRKWLGRLGVGAGARPRPTGRPPRRLGLEALEDRLAPAIFTFTVDRITDAGATQLGVGSGNSGDLRYCVARANAPHGSSGDTDRIKFDASVFGSAQAISLSAALRTLTITDSHHLSIQGPAGTVTVSGNNTFGIFVVDAGSDVTFDHVRVTQGHTAGNGGGIDSSGTITLTYCTIDHNSANGGGYGGGGGIFNQGTVTLTDCTIDHNSAARGSLGGGIDNLGTATFTNCTVDANQSAGDGGGIESLIGTTTLTNCTIVRNSAAGFGGGIRNSAEATLNLKNTLIALNSALAGPDLSNFLATIGTDSHNCIGNGTGSTLTNGHNGDIVGTAAHPIDPKVGPLRNNGGPTQTVALLAASPAIDAGDDGVLNPPGGLTTDQRGLPRKAGKHVDVGAFEYQPPRPSPPPPPPPPSPPPVRRGRIF